MRLRFSQPLVRGALTASGWRSSIGANFIGTAGPAYLTTTINEFRGGKRGNSPGMADLLRTYSADDVKVIVAYLSSLE